LGIGARAALAMNGTDDSSVKEFGVKDAQPYPLPASAGTGISNIAIGHV
jgi:hypothetical protein